MPARYEIFGDIHGHAAELIELLQRLGYREINGAYRHPERIALFVGDLIDRGPAIREVLQLVKGMYDQDAAQVVLGNHEFNALAFHTSHEGRPLREHSDKNLRQHGETLRQVPHDELKRYLDWFRRLPPALSLPGLRVVHACWDPDRIREINAAFDAFGGWNVEFLRSATDPDTALFQAVEDVLKGKEQCVPEGQLFTDKDGHKRNSLRVQWYRTPVNDTFASYALPCSSEVPALPLPSLLDRPVHPYPHDAPPVFFGHYWLRSDVPGPLTANVACLDYSIARKGRLCAYRWDGERELVADRFVHVPARS